MIFKDKSRIKKIQPAIILSAAFSFVFFVYAPAEMYLNNISDVSYDIYDVLRCMLPVAVIAFLILSAVFFALKGKARTILTVLIFAALTASYIQGTFMSGLLSIIDNRNVDWSIFSRQRLETVALWLAVLAACLILLRTGKLEKTVTVVSVMLSAMLLVSAVITGVTRGGFTDKKSIAVTDDGILEMSDDRNFIMLVLDSVDSEVFDRQLGGNGFPDFTFYENTVSTYLETKYSVPFIISGQWYENEEPFAEYEDNVYSTSRLFELLKGYKLGMYYTDLPGTDAVIDRFENVIQTGNKFAVPSGFVKMQLMLTGLKYLPYDLKRFCVLSTDEIYRYSARKCGESVFTNDNDVFLRKLDDGIESTGDRVFKLVLLNGAHAPFVDDSYEKSVDKSIDIAKRFIDEMKKADVYDKSIIFIMADHGCNGDDIEGRQHPLLMVKGIDEHHPFEKSDAPVSYADLMDAYETLLSGSNEIFRFKDDYRVRRYISFYGQTDGLLECYE